MRVSAMIGLAGALMALAPAPGSARPPRAATECVPGAPCRHPLPVKVVIVTMFEIGADTGDAPGEFQLWKERRHLDTRIPFPQSWHDLWYDPRTQVLGMVTGIGSFKAASAVTALGLDPRVDVSHAYWLVAGIAGIDPEDASLGSAAWARYVVDGDLAHEIDSREIPAGWRFGRFPLSSTGERKAWPRRDHGELFPLNQGLERWAFALTKDMTLSDDPALAAGRARYVGYPAALKPPFVLEGDEITAITFWHGKLLNDWANDWVRFWTEGKGEMVTSAEEDSGTIQALRYLGRIGKADDRRLLILRAGSDYTVPPPGISPADNLRHENAGFSGMHASLESLYVVGSKVVDALLADWRRFRDAPPGK